jgi:chromosome segregation ATPase
MGRPARFSFEEVANACVHLDGRGMLSADNIITHLGGGSKLTILRHYNAWLDSRRAATARPLEMFSADLRAALAREWEKVSDEARSDLQDRLTQLDEQLRAALNSLEKAEEGNDHLKMQLTQDREAAAAQERDRGQEVAASQAQAAALQGQVEKLSEKLEREIAGSENARLDAAQARNKLETTEKSLQTFTQQHDSLMTDQKVLQKQLGETQRRADLSEERLSSREREAAAAKAAFEDEKGRRQAVEEALAAARQELVTTERRAASAEARAESRDELLQALREESSERRERLALLERSLASSRSELTAAQVELGVCRSEYAQLSKAASEKSPSRADGRSTQEARPQPRQRGEKADDEGG